MNIKEELHVKSIAFVNTKLATIEKIISSNQKALESETKSSAGDKHETGRAMLQLEMEKVSQQFLVVNQMKDTLHKIDVEKTVEVVCLGAIVETNIANYFISVSVGELKIGSKKYYAVSTSSPIGKLLLGKRIDNEVVFNNRTIKIKNIL